MKSFITTSCRQTRKLGEILAGELRGGEIICLSGDLGSGKTTFAQGLLKGLGIKGPYTSPTFTIMKQYRKKIRNSQSKTKSKFKILTVYHADAYRVTAQDILALGWKEIVSSKNNIIIVEWAERIKKIIPRGSLWINFKRTSEKKRELTIDCK